MGFTFKCYRCGKEHTFGDEATRCNGFLLNNNIIFSKKIEELERRIKELEEKNGRMLPIK